MTLRSRAPLRENPATASGDAARGRRSGARRYAHVRSAAFERLDGDGTGAEHGPGADGDPGDGGGAGTELCAFPDVHTAGDVRIRVQRGEGLYDAVVRDLGVHVDRRERA